MLEPGREFVAAIAETHANGGFTKAIRSIAARRGEPWLETHAKRARHRDCSDSGADSDDDNKLLYVGGSVSSPIEGVSLGIAYDDLESPNGPDQDAVAIYALWDVSDGVSLATRYDTLDDGSDSKSMWSVTLGYSVWENVLTRLEYNYETGDRDDGDSTGFALNLFYQF